MARVRATGGRKRTYALPVWSRILYCLGAARFSYDNSVIGVACLATPGPSRDLVRVRMNRRFEGGAFIAQRV
jgi:hypothetical protein